MYQIIQNVFGMIIDEFRTTDLGLVTDKLRLESWLAYLGNTPFVTLW